MDSAKNSLIEQNIRMLEKGITLKEYLEKEDQIKIDGDTKIYNKYGYYVIYNKTKNIYLVDGGNSGFSMSTTISTSFITNSSCGNPYMNKHYMEGDEFVLLFWRFYGYKYKSMEHMKECIEKYYDAIAETYYDYIMRIYDEKYTKKDRPKDYNSYYNGKSQRKLNNSIAAFLLRLENKSKFLYNLLNAIVDILVKSIPFLIFTFNYGSRGLFNRDNPILNVVVFVLAVFSSYVIAIVYYLLFLVIIQIIKLFVCTYKPLVIHFRILDIVIDLTSKKIRNSASKGLNDLLYEHDCIISAREEKRENGKSRAYEKKKKRDIKKAEAAQRNYEFSREQYEKEKEKAQDDRRPAQYTYQIIKNGGAIFYTDEELRESAERDLRCAESHEQQSMIYEKQMRAYEKKAKKKK